MGLNFWIACRSEPRSLLVYFIAYQSLERLTPRIFIGQLSQLESTSMYFTNCVLAVCDPRLLSVAGASRTSCQQDSRISTDGLSAGYKTHYYTGRKRLAALRLFQQQLGTAGSSHSKDGQLGEPQLVFTPLYVTPVWAADTAK